MKGQIIVSTMHPLNHCAISDSLPLFKCCFRKEKKRHYMIQVDDEEHKQSQPRQDTVSSGLSKFDSVFAIKKNPNLKAEMKKNFAKAIADSDKSVKQITREEI